MSEKFEKHYDRHNEGVCSVCGCTTARWKSVCDSCRIDEIVKWLIKKEELKKKEENHNEDHQNNARLGVDISRHLSGA